MTRTAIEWTDETWNPVTGCTKVSPGCDHCYAETLAERFRGGKAFPNGFDVQLRPEKLHLPLTWRTPRRVFVNSMSDLFHDSIPDEFIAQVFAVMALTPWHTYQVLTKRHGRMRSFFTRPVEEGVGWLPGSYATWVIRDALTEIGRAGLLGAMDPLRLTEEQWGLTEYSPDVDLPLPNVWLGVSVEDQKRATLRVPALIDTPAAVRFLSCEPLLGSVRLSPLDANPPAIDWVIVGGESGAGARPMDPQWARTLRDECAEFEIPFFFKQWGAFGEDGKRSSKHRTGRHLDGELHDEYPTLDGPAA